MITIDGIIYTLQRTGGISRYTDQVRGWLCNQCVTTKLFDREDIRSVGKNEKLDHQRAKFLERIRTVDVSNETHVFFSSYYRIPSRTYYGKNILTVHDFTHERFLPLKQRIPNSLLKKRAIASASEIICISENTKRDLLYYYGSVIGPKAKVHVIHHGIKEVSTDARRTVPELQDLNKKQRIAMFVGSRACYKNFALAIQAVSENKDWHLQIVGGGQLSGHEKDLLSAKLKHRHTHFTNVSDELLYDMYFSCDALLHPSLYEGFGLTLIEAMSASLPVVALQNSSVSEIVTPDYPLYNMNTKDFISSLKTLQNDRIYKECQEVGLKIVKRFNVEKTQKLTLELFNIT